MSSDNIFAITLLAASALTSGFFAYMHGLRRHDYLMLWSAGWCLLALHYLSPALEPWMIVAPWQSAVNEWLLAAAALLFFSTARVYTKTQPWVIPQVAAGVVFALWAAAFYFHSVSISPDLGVAIVLAGVAWVFFKDSRRHETFVTLLLAVSLLSWSVILFCELLAGPRLADLLRILEILPQLFSAALMIMGLYEEEKRSVEQNLLALSNVNLATFSFAGVEIEKMLSQALERVLSVMRVPAGAMFLHHSNTEDPASVVAVGLAEDFCGVAQDEGLDDHFMDLVSRLGGLVVFRDLGSDTSWAALEDEEAFQRFRKLALSQRLRTVVGISLHSKVRAFGVLVLGTPDNRRFTAAELRLLLALGHQIGMAFENNYLVQQTARRSEELHMLNEVGRALNSTLDPEALFETILSEIKRLFDFSRFYIALHDPARNLIHYEVEFRDGVTIPKRSRPVTDNYVTEYLMRTRQPLLIRENLSQEIRKLGLELKHQSGGCFCGVPLMLYERAIGVLAVQSSQERVIDAGHMEMIRVLASEVVIALENARLFRNEQSKSRRITLLNDISRNVIATLNPDEMLAKIAENLEQASDYSHIGIGLLDYSTKEIVIQAEAGRRKGALGSRLQLDKNILGHVARVGQMVVANYLDSSGTPHQPVLEGSVSAIALPIAYADQLHGVLYVESDQSSDFSQEEILFLGTLADLISGALHNALAFQRAQEQAITDGLTGLKTHRFFMEALSGEWKRSTRADRGFSLVLMDLDRFKFVNDFYGHLDGDLVLQRVAHILDENCRRSDVVARYGGDEFVILMPETDAEQAQLLASKLRSWICADPLLREKNVTSSFGVATYPTHGSTPQELIQVADSSMYLSKHQGGNAVSAAEHCNPDDSKQWKRDVLEAYLGVTLKRLFTTGPDAFVEIYSRIEQFARSLTETEASTPPGKGNNASKSDSALPFEPLPRAVMDTLTSLALAVDAKDRFTQGHCQKVSGYAGLVAEALGLVGPEVEAIRLGGMLHDVGKVGILESILNKSGPLDIEEWETMKRHAEFGAKLLEPLRGTERVREMVAHHHEFFDGSGYPNGLTGTQIPLGARLIAIADAYDTITSDRTYKKACTPYEALIEIERCAGAQFDPELVRVFVSRMRELPNPLINNPAAPREHEVLK